MHSTAHAAASSFASSCSWPSPRAAASPAACTSSGRTRLPPPSTAYRMAECSRTGTRSARGSARSKADSTRAWTRPIQAAKSVVGVGTGKVLERVLFENLHLLLRLGEQVLAVLRELEPALVSGERLLQAELARFHAAHDLLQLGQCGLEAARVFGVDRFGHRDTRERPRARKNKGVTIAYRITPG